jgi:hypothetical protein
MRKLIKYLSRISLLSPLLVTYLLLRSSDLKQHLVRANQGAGIMVFDCYGQAQFCNDMQVEFVDIK